MIIGRRDIGEYNGPLKHDRARLAAARTRDNGEVVENCRRVGCAIQNLISLHLHLSDAMDRNLDALSPGSIFTKYFVGTPVL